MELTDFGGAPGGLRDKKERQTRTSLFTHLNPGSHMYRSRLATSNHLVWKTGTPDQGSGESLLLLRAPPLGPRDPDLGRCASFRCRCPPPPRRRTCCCPRGGGGALSPGSPSEGTDWSGAEAAGGGGRTGRPGPGGLQAWAGASLPPAGRRCRVRSRRAVWPGSWFQRSPAAAGSESERKQTGSAKVTDAHAGQMPKTQEGGGELRWRRPRR